MEYTEYAIYVIFRTYRQNNKNFLIISLQINNSDGFTIKYLGDFAFGGRLQRNKVKV